MHTLVDALSPAAHSAAAAAAAIVLPPDGTHRERIVSHAQLHAHVLSFQRKLAALGVGRGSAVSIALPNSYAFVVAFLAAAAQRAIAAPLNPAYTQPEFAFYIGDLSSALVLVPRGLADGPAVTAARKYRAAVAECYMQDGGDGDVALDVKDTGKLAGNGGGSDAPLPKPQPDDVALVLHTSGTTGRPKAVPLTHRNLTRTMANITRTYALAPSDRGMLVMPLFHVHGLLAGLLAPLAAGGSLIVPPGGGFSASNFWRHFVAHGANWYTAVPTMHQLLLRNRTLWPTPMPAIRFARSCSSPLSPTVHAQLEAALGAPVLEAYAMTEAAHQITSNPLPAVGERKSGSVGRGQGVEVVILAASNKDEEIAAPGVQGEIAIRGPNVTKGYLNNPAANADSFTRPTTTTTGGGFFRTGDMGWLDPDGYLHITGRIKELINKAGEKISPVELDNVLARHAAVAEAVSFAVPDDLYGQDVGVAIVRKAEIGEEDVRAYMRDNVAAFKVPKRVFFTDVMPKTATGKIQRRNVAMAMLEGEKKKKKAVKAKM